MKREASSAIANRMPRSLRQSSGGNLHIIAAGVLLLIMVLSIVIYLLGGSVDIQVKLP